MLRPYQMRVLLLAGQTVRVSTISSRLFTTTTPWNNTAVASDMSYIPDVPTTKLTKDQLKRRELKRKLRQKTQARLPPHTDPLYTPTPLALRILRSIEVGQPISQQTITCSIQLINEKGVVPLNGEVHFPHPLKSSRIIAFSTDESLLSQVRNDCFTVGGQDLINKLLDGEIDVASIDKCVATSEMVPLLNKQLGRILGRRGIMPNMKRPGTVGPDLLSLVKDSQGKVTFRQRGGSGASLVWVNVSVGNVSMSDSDIMENLISLRDGVRESLKLQKEKAARKNQVSLVGRVTLTSTHGPGLTIDFM